MVCKLQVVLHEYNLVRYHFWTVNFHQIHFNLTVGKGLSGLAVAVVHVVDEAVLLVAGWGAGVPPLLHSPVF